MANRCPRYYESLYLLGEVGISTKISQEDKLALDKKWKGFEATLREEAASISGGVDNDTKAMSIFCPEVSYKIFGLFASGLYPHHGEIDRDIAYASLGREGADLSDPRWQWAAVTPCHYTECSEYSILQREGTTMEFDEKKKQAAGGMVFNIGTVRGMVGNINNSQVTLYDYSSVHQMLKNHGIKREDRDQLEDILDALKAAPHEEKPSLIDQGERWLVKHKDALEPV